MIVLIKVFKFPKVSIPDMIRNPLKNDEHYDLIYLPKAIVLVSRMPVFEL